MVNKTSYDEFPKRIMGHYPSHYQKDHICQILTHYGTRHAKSALKVVLLRQLVTTEKKIPEHEKEIIHGWLNQWPAPKQRFEDFFSKAHRVAEGSDDSQDDVPLAKRTRASSRRAKAITVARLPTIECAVCMETKTRKGFPEGKVTPSCDHEPMTCYTCLTTTIETQIADGPWDQITCPECPELIPYAAVQKFVSIETFDRYDRKMVIATIEHIPGFTLCLGANCGSGQVHGGGEEQPIMTCTTCNFKTCFKHKLPWHTGQTCDEYDAATKERAIQEAASQKYLAKATKRCPNPKCGLHCVKITGCNHITCHHCRHQWCYICFATYLGPNGILQQGNSAHDVTCMYYSNNLPAHPETPAQPAAAPAIVPVAPVAQVPAVVAEQRTIIQRAREVRPPTPESFWETLTRVAVDVLVSTWIGERRGRERGGGLVLEYRARNGGADGHTTAGPNARRNVTRSRRLLDPFGRGRPGSGGWEPRRQEKHNRILN